MIDLTGGEVKVIGNRGDKHLFRLSNPVEQDIINPSGEYQAEFFVSYKSTSISSVPLDNTEIATGSLLFFIIINNGFYRIRRLNPSRTLLTIEVESR